MNARVTGFALTKEKKKNADHFPEKVRTVKTNGGSYEKKYVFNKKKKPGKKSFFRFVRKIHENNII